MVYKMTGVDLSAGDPMDQDAFDIIMKDDAFLDELRNMDEGFRQWFDRNHFEAERMVKTADGKGEMRLVQTRTALWSHTTPSNQSFYKGFGLKDAQGNLVGVLRDINGTPRVPNMNYTNRIVKDQYKTEVIERDFVDKNGNLVLATQDNQGNWLPREDVEDKSFVNEDYRRMFTENRAEWDLLQYVKNHHLDNQKGLSHAQKLGLEYPRTRMGKQQGIGLGKIYNRHGENIAEGFKTSRWGESIQNMWRTQEDDIEFGYNSRQNEDGAYRLNTLTRPITGMYDLPINEVSTDIIDILGKHQHSIETFKGLSEINSMGQTLRAMVSEVLTTPEADAIRDKARTLQFTSKDTKLSNRARAVGAMIDQHFKGLSLDPERDPFGGSKPLAVALRQIMGWSSRKWFMFNFMSDVTNYLSGRVQFFYKTFDSRHFNYKNMQVGKFKAKKAIRVATRTQYSAGQKPIQVQLMDILDASPDRFQTTVGGGR